MRFDGGFLNFGMRIIASGDDASIRFGCLGVPVSTPELSAGLLLWPDSSVLSLSRCSAENSRCGACSSGLQAWGFSFAPQVTKQRHQIREIVCANLSRAL